MGIKKAPFVIKGMNRDLAATRFSPEYAFENKNIRILATDKNDTLSLVNERGTLKVTNGILANLEGTPVGQAVINDSMILFTAGESGEDKVDHIYRLYIGGGSVLFGEELCTKDLNLSPYSPIESISVYENSGLQKVYWTDGENQPRVINVAATAATKAKWNTIDDPFDFVRKIGLKEEVTVTRNLVANGSFAPGTVQYAITYYNIYGQQSNIFYVSPIYYVSYNNRGASSDDNVGVSFSINIENGDYTYDYVRIYCIQRTSVNATPIVRRAADIAIKTEGTYVYPINYTDYGDTGEIIDPTDLFFVGGKEIVAGTFTQKENTLFLGDIQAKHINVDSSICTYLSGTSITFGTKYLDIGYPSSYYSYVSQLNENSQTITTYKVGETYRFGVQFQDTHGNWSNPVYLNDAATSTYPYSGSDGGVISLVKPTAQIYNSNHSVLSTLVNAGYVKARPVVVFPSFSDRTIICQGILAPTVYNVEDRYNKFPDVQSSWFFRPIYNTSYISTYGSQPIRGAEYIHNRAIPSNTDRRAEIQCILYPPSDPFLGITHDGYTEKSSAADWVAENRENFYVDQSVVTFHSPDIEFDKDTRSIDSSGLALRIVGYVPIDANTSDIDIETSTPPLNYSKGENEEYSSIAPGFYHRKMTRTTGYNSYDILGGWSMLSGPFWLDEFYKSSTDNIRKLNAGFIVYPWHRNGSLNNTKAVDAVETVSAMLTKKKMSILRFSKNTVFSNSGVWTPPNGISGVSIFDSNADTIIKIPAPHSSVGELTYSGNVDKIIAFHTKMKSVTLDRDLDADILEGQYVSNATSAYYPIVVASKYDSQIPGDEEFNFKTDNAEYLFYRPYSKLKVITGTQGDYTLTNYVGDDVQTCTNDPVSMKYKSTPHAIIAFNYDSNNRQVILPKFTSQTWGTPTSSGTPFWRGSNLTVNQSNFGMTMDSNGRAYMWLAELYNPNPPTDRFGGTSQEAFENNQWLPAGNAVSLVDGSGNVNSSITLEWLEGDTYYQRYDCLKTYPYTMEDQNSVVDILSFMCETRVNIDGRYDRNRGQANNLYMNPANFNLLNTAYTQKNNFFNYRGTNYNKLVLNAFPNIVTWTKTKTLGEQVDSWTNITLASSIDLDGDKGIVRALRRFKDSIIAFQDKGISQVLFNESVQLTTTKGTPVELANSGKVQGKRYLTDKIGCINKYSICSTPAGIYFVDNIAKDIYVYNGEFNNLSDTQGLHSWVVNNLGNISPWTPGSFNNCITFYDSVNNDVLFVTDTTCLAYSEPLGAFSSFYDYGHTPCFATIRNKSVAIHKGNTLEVEHYYPYLHREGNYNQFYDLYKPYWTTVVVNPDPTEDKIFNNLEFRSDAFDTNNEDAYLPAVTYDTLTVWDEYQRGLSTLANTKDRPSTLKKKFRVWRANIPRNTTNQGGDETHSYTRDRMRNPWLYLKLSMEDQTTLSNNYKTILYDMVVDYFE